MLRRGHQSFLATLRQRAFAPVDIASLVFFRIVFGLLMVREVCRIFALHRIATDWIEPRFLFKYYGFSWVQPWPGSGLYIHWAALGLFALFVATGFCYRVSAALLFVSYAYFFLLDEAQYVNHTYLTCLFCFLLVFVPAHRAFSVDAWLRPKIHSQSTPAWTLWLLRLQMGVVYFFAGLAKLLSTDWLQGEPMRTRMAYRTDFPVLGQFFRDEWAVYGISHAGLLIDLFIVPFLLWRRTRVAAFCVAVLFHLMNARWWPLGIFPWLAIAGTSLFLSPGWPRRVLALVRLPRPYSAPRNWRPPSRRTQSMVLGLASVYAAVQLFLPLRHFLFGGGVEWKLAEHRFSWRMMLVTHFSRATFYVTDPNSGRTLPINPRQFLTLRQKSMLAYLPDFPLQFAHYLATVAPRRGPQPLKVEARILVSINGRQPALYLDPNVDLAAEERSLGRPRWLRSNHEPMPPPEKKYTGETKEPVGTGADER